MSSSSDSYFFKNCAKQPPASTPWYSAGLPDDGVNPHFYMPDESSSDESDDRGPAWDPTGAALENHPENNDFPDEESFTVPPSILVSEPEDSNTEQASPQKPQESGSQLLVSLLKSTSVFAPEKGFLVVGIDLEIGNTNRRFGGPVSPGAVFTF